jgi:hypothetical protein
MKKIIIWSLGAGALLFSACDNDRATTTDDTVTGTANTTEIGHTGQMASEETGGMHPDSVYREKAVFVTEKMAEDLKLDEEAQAIAKEIFYHRSKRKAEAQEKFAKNEFRLNQELAAIAEETDQQVLSILTYSQSREYVQNRDEYADPDFSEISRTDNDLSGGMTLEDENSDQNLEAKGNTDNR